MFLIHHFLQDIPSITASQGANDVMRQIESQQKVRVPKKVRVSIGLTHLAGSLMAVVKREP